jgi:hypothetical protein
MGIVMRYPKAVFFTFITVILLSASCFAAIAPALGTFDTEYEPITGKTIIFNPVAPWTTDSYMGSTSISVYATGNHEQGYARDGSEFTNTYNITSISLGLQEFNGNKGEVSGYLALCYSNDSGEIAKFSATVATVFFKNNPMEIYLPKFDLAIKEDMHFWVADDGSTYFANMSGIDGASGGPTMSAQESIDGGFIAAANVNPEPATLMLFGLGGFFLRRRK